MADRAAADARTLDVSAFCRHGGASEGTWPLNGMPRLLAGLSSTPATTAQWSAQGSLLAVPGGEAQLWLTLQASAAVPLQCQRCLQPMTQELAVDRRFRFVRDETLAEQLDEDAEDDVLALPQRLDLHELLQDELILALPLVPRHAVCPEPLPMPGDNADGEGEAAAHPFAALAALRGGTTPH